MGVWIGDKRLFKMQKRNIKLEWKIWIFNKESRWSKWNKDNKINKTKEMGFMVENIIDIA